MAVQNRRKDSRLGEKYMRLAKGSQLALTQISEI